MSHPVYVVRKVLTFGASEVSLGNQQHLQLFKKMLIELLQKVISSNLLGHLVYQFHYMNLANPGQIYGLLQPFAQ